VEIGACTEGVELWSQSCETVANNAFSTL